MTPYNLDQSQWFAWQFDCPERGEELIQAFRRGESAYEAASFKLGGLDPDAKYRLTDIDGRRKFTVKSGRELAETGLVLPIAEQPGSIVVTYARLD